MLLRPVLPTIFSGDAAVQHLTAFLLIHVAVMQPVNGAVFALDGILIGAGDQRYLAGAMVLAAAIFVPAVVLVRALDVGIGWLWLAVEGLMVARLVPLALRYRSGRWIVLGECQCIQEEGESVSGHRAIIRAGGQATLEPDPCTPSEEPHPDDRHPDLRARRPRHPLRG